MFEGKVVRNFSWIPMCPRYYLELKFLLVVRYRLKGISENNTLNSN